MKIDIFDDYDSMSGAASRFIARRVINDPGIVLALPTGDTPKGLYRNLIDFYKSGLVDFYQTTTFNLDEYYPVSAENPVSFTKYMYDHFFNHVNIPEERIHIPDGTADQAGKECEKYENSIERSGGIDLAILGIGENGHIGYNEPGSEFGSKTRLVKLEDNYITGEVPGREGETIDRALTMGITTIMKAREILLIASGARKAKAIKKTVDGSITKDLPASILQLHPNTKVYLDKEAANLIDNT